MSPTPRRRCPITRLLSIAAVALFLSIPTAASATLGPPVDGVPASAASCSRTYTRAMFHAAARSYFRRPAAAKHRTLSTTIRCQRGGARSRRIARFHLGRYRRAHARRAAVARVTPYPGPVGTRWAIPYAIVACESGGSWSAANPSGAIGPYQLLGWGAPWPANTAAARLRHHQLAAMVWAGGAGRSNWVC